MTSVATSVGFDRSGRPSWTSTFACVVLAALAVYVTAVGAVLVASALPGGAEEVLLRVLGFATWPPFPAAPLADAAVALMGAAVAAGPLAWAFGWRGPRPAYAWTFAAALGGATVAVFEQGSAAQPLGILVVAVATRRLAFAPDGSPAPSPVRRPRAALAAVCLLAAASAGGVYAWAWAHPLIPGPRTMSVAAETRGGELAVDLTLRNAGPRAAWVGDRRIAPGVTADFATTLPGTCAAVDVEGLRLPYAVEGGGRSVVDLGDVPCRRPR